MSGLRILLYHRGYTAVCFYFFPTVFMDLVYYKIGRALIKQNKEMKCVCSNAVRSRYVQNRRTFFVCVWTVLCFTVGTLLFTVYLPTEFFAQYNLPFRFWYLCRVLLVAGSQAVNPFIYGVFDKKLLTF